MKPNEVLTTEQRDDVLQRSDIKAWVAVMVTWTLTLITLMLVGHFPSFVTLALAWDCAARPTTEFGGTNA